MPKSPTRPTQYPSPQWARELQRGKPRHSCRGGRPGSFLETHGTLLHGKRLSVALMVRVLTCLAEGLGMRATARVFEVAPQPGAGVAGGSGRASPGLCALLPV